MATALFSHNDLDGIGGAIIGNVLGFDIVKCTSYNPGQYQFQNVVRNVINQIGNIERVFIVDIAMTNEIWNEIVIDVKDLPVTLIDHHETSIAADAYKDKIRCILDTSRSATKIFYDEYVNDYPELSNYEFLIEGINAYDTWQFELSPIAKDLQRIYNYCVFQNPKTKFVKFDEKLRRFTQACLNDPIMNEMMYPEWCNSALNLYKLATAKKINKTIENLKFDKNVCIIESDSEDNIPTYEISWYIEENNPEITDYIYVIKNKSYIYYSLRSRRTENEIDVSKIAESYGGGGHAKASAFNLDIDKTPGVTEDLVSQLLLKE